MKEGKIEKSEDRQGGFSSAAHVWYNWVLLQKLSRCQGTLVNSPFNILPFQGIISFEDNVNLMHMIYFLILCIFCSMFEETSCLARGFLEMLAFLWPVACGCVCPMSHDAVRLPHQFHHESMSCFTRALHGLRMAAPRKVAIIGSGNW